MTMQIIIDQDEIETAIKNHIGTKIQIAQGQSVSVDLKAGRGENGFSATIEIGDTAQQAKTDAKPAVTRAASKPVAEEVSPQTTQEAPSDAAQEAGTDAAEQGETSQGEADAQAEPAQEGSDKPKSIFGNLAKPRNS